MRIIMDLSVVRSDIASEFTSEQLRSFFSKKEKVVSHHVDSLYYSVYLCDDYSNKENEKISELISEIAYLKSLKQRNQMENFDFHGLEVLPFGASVSGGLYGLRLNCPENYDIFISSYLPNDETPRIQVQLRTRYLVLEGLYNAIEKSYKKLVDILWCYGLTVLSVEENRIDYAFHTNVIKKPMEMFSDESLEKHLVTNFREAWSHKWITTRHKNFFELDYIALGSRKSNNVYFRVYNKGKEVVQENYKGFFFKIWRDRGLISEYDLFCYEEAYRLKSYKTGLNIGRIKWYLEHGNNAELKTELTQLMESCNIKSDNNPHMEKRLQGLLPPVTLIMNIEFETKRKFYLRLSDFYNAFKLVDDDCEILKLKRLFQVLKSRDIVLKWLTTEEVNFTVNRSDPDSPSMDWWKRIRRAKVDDKVPADVFELWFSYGHNLDYERNKNSLLGKIASVSLLSDAAPTSDIGSDLWNVVSNLNDNDLAPNGSLHKELSKLSVVGYDKIRQKRQRRMKPLLDYIDELAVRKGVGQATILEELKSIIKK